jgi:hypothetical protein
MTGSLTLVRYTRSFEIFVAMDTLAPFPMRAGDLVTQQILENGSGD